MTSTVLLDFDDTLLFTHIGEFLPTILKGLARRLPLLDRKKINAQFQGAVGRMVDIQDHPENFETSLLNRLTRRWGRTDSESRPARLKEPASGSSKAARHPWR